MGFRSRNICGAVLLIAPISDDCFDNSTGTFPVQTKSASNNSLIGVRSDNAIVKTGNHKSDDMAIAFRPILADSPGFVDRDPAGDFSIDGDLLTLEMKSFVAANGDKQADFAGRSTVLNGVSDG